MSDISFNNEDINNAILTGIVKTLEIMKDVRDQGDDLNTIDFDEVIEMRMRDMTNRNIYDSTQEADDEDNQ